ncbi:MAG: sialidase family protein [Lentisphaeria bacterium]
MKSYFELKHSPGNPRNSEGSFVALKDKRILFIYTRYNGDSWADHASADLAAISSDDDGRSWSQPRIIRKNDATNIMSVSLLRLHDGRIACMYLRKSEIGPGCMDCRPWMIFSADEAVTWSEPQEVTGLPPTYLIINNDRLIQLKTGRLIIPAALHRYKQKDWDHRAIALFFLSDDAGKSWREAQQWVLPPATLSTGFQEPGVCELSDQRLLAYFRNSSGAQYQAFSEDAGESWSEPQRSTHFPSPTAPLSIKSNPANAELFAVWCDIDPRWGIVAEEGSWGRTPLVLARSIDNGASWYGHRMLENKPDHGYCYCAMLFSGSSLLLAYCCGGGLESKVLQDLRIRRIEL